MRVGIIGSHRVELIKDILQYLEAQGHELVEINNDYELKGMRFDSVVIDELAYDKPETDTRIKRRRRGQRRYDDKMNGGNRYAL